MAQPDLQEPCHDNTDITTTTRPMLALSKMPQLYELPQHCDKYQRQGKHGLCIIINNEYFRTKKRREGTQKDLKELKEVFEKLLFTVETHTDCSKDQVMAILESIRYKRNYSSLFVFFLTHGCKNAIYGVDERPISIYGEIHEVLKAERCPPFENKPKVLVFQSCQTEGMITDPQLPIEKHFLLAFACQPYTEAYRNLDRGSFYIQTLVKVIRENSERMDFLKILTRVRQILNEESYFRDSTNGQSPSENSQLTCDLYLTRRVTRSMIVTTHQSSEDIVISRSALSLDKDIIATPNALNTFSKQRSSSNSTSSDRSINEVVSGIPKMNTATPETSKRFGLCLIIGNICLTREIERVTETFNSCYNYIVLRFLKISKRNINILLEGIKNLELSSLVVFFLSQGEQNILYDANNEEIPMEDIFRHFGDKMQDVHKLFFFQTTSQPSYDVEERMQLQNATLPQRSVCFHVSTSSSVIDNLHRLEEYMLVDMYNIRELLIEVIERDPTRLKVFWKRIRSRDVDVTIDNFDFNIKCAQRPSKEIYLKGLEIIAHFKSTLGQAFGMNECNKGMECYRNSILQQSATVSNSRLETTGSDSYHSLNDTLTANAKQHLDYLYHLNKHDDHLKCQLRNCEKFLEQNIVISVESVIMSSQVNIVEDIKECIANYKDDTLRQIETLRDYLNGRPTKNEYSNPVEEILRGNSPEDEVF